MEHIVNAAGTRFMHLLGNVLKVKVGKCIAGSQSNVVENNFIIAYVVICNDNVHCLTSGFNYFSESRKESTDTPIYKSTLTFFVA